LTPSFNNLPQPPIPTLPSSIPYPSNVINLSSIDLDPPSLLEKGFNFSPIPHRINIKDILCSMESITHHLPTHEAEEIRQACGRILHLSKPPKPSLSKEEFQYICHLNDNPNIIILKFDKGNAIVIMNTSNYKSEFKYLRLSSSYNTISKNPINSRTRLVIKAIKSSSFNPYV